MDIILIKYISYFYKQAHMSREKKGYIRRYKSNNIEPVELPILQED